MVRIKGREYATVAERLQAAHGEGIRPAGIASISTEPLAVGSTVVVRATVTFADGRTFSGLAEVIETDSGAQQTNPVECAETSAVGRALAMAGYFGSEGAIAGAEEVRAAVARQQPVTPASARAATGVHGPTTRPVPPAWRRAG